ncbi:MAG: START domain-containing protein [Proteobacteria bacterium]|nr:START domain-containing protein [Pseudomonadota bacterium]MDA1292003.1 START domain-containing protein [Pseudomonadota bacterium]
MKKDENGIQVYTRSVDGYSYKAIRSVVHLEETRLSSVVSLIRNSKDCPGWSDSCVSATIIEWVSELENYVHTITDLPWPVQDRDLVSHVIWQQDPETLVVTMQGNATRGKLEENEGVVRLTEAQINWELTALENSVVKVVLEAHINPASLLPSWITNMLLVDSPYSSMEGLRERVKLKSYQEVELAYIHEI